MSIYKIFPSLDQTFLKTCSFLFFYKCSILVFVRLLVTLIRFPFNFLLYLKIFTLTLYLENYMIIDRGLFLSDFPLPKRCDLSISCVISSFISFLKILITTSSVFSWFSLSISCINKQFFLKYCFWRSEALSTLSTLLKKCQYSELFWSAFSRIQTEYGPEYLRIRTLFTQC